MKLKGRTQGPDSLQVKRQATTLRQMVYTRLRQAIIDQDLPPGSKLIERNLCERLGISRPSLREALNRLEVEKLIEMVPHKGAVVSTLSSQDIQEIQNVRAVIGRVVCDKFVQMAGEDDRAILESVLAGMRTAIRERDQVAVSSCLATFQETLLSGSGDLICREVLETLGARIEIIHQMSIQGLWDIPQMLSTLEALISAGIAQNGSALKEHLNAWLSQETSCALNQLLHRHHADGGSPRDTSQGTEKATR